MFPISDFSPTIAIRDRFSESGGVVNTFNFPYLVTLEELFAYQLGECLTTLLELFANIPGLEVEIEEARLAFADPDPAAVPGAMDALLYAVEQLVDVSQLTPGSQQVLILANDILVEAGVRASTAP